MRSLTIIAELSTLKQVQFFGPLCICCENVADSREM